MMVSRAIRAAALVCMVSSCSGSRQVYNPVTPPTGEEPVVAAAVTGVAVGVYALGGGCRIADCPADTVCNPASERCERIECGGPLTDPNAGCPASSQCSANSGTCVPF
jgi:hypothetical protein